MALAPPSVADVERAVMTMYSGAGDERQRAIRWLAEFSQLPASADVYPALLRSASGRVQFYGAAGVYNSVVSHWHRLSEEQRTGLSTFLWGCLADAGRLETPVRRKLCSALAAVAVLGAGWGEALGATVARVCAFTAGGAPPLAVLLHVELLECLADEVDRRPMPHARADRVRAEMASCMPGVYAALTWAVTDVASPFCSPGDTGGRERGVCAALLAARAWTRYGAALGQLWSTSRGLLGAAVAALALDPFTGSRTWAATSVAASELLEAVVEVRRYPREPERSAALVYLVEALVAVHARLSRALPAGGGAGDAGLRDALHSLALVANCVATIEDAWCAGEAASAPHALGIPASACPFLFAESDQAAAAQAAGVDLGGVAARLPVGHITVGGTGAGVGVLLGDLLLQLSAAADLRVAQECLAGAMAIQALDSSSRHPFFKRPFFRQLTLVIAHQCGVGDTAGRVNDALAEYRGPRSPIRDALPDACAQLREEFLSVLLAWLRVGAPPRLVGLALHPLPPGARLEAVLFCLDAASPTLLDIMAESDADAAASAGARSADGALEESTAALVELITGDAGVAGIASNMLLAGSACAWLGGLARWLGARHPGTSLRCAVEQTGAPPVEASFRLVPVSHVTRSAVRYALAALSHARVALRSDAGDSKDSLEHVATHIGARVDDGGGDSVDSDGGGSAAAEDGGSAPLVLARKAAAALSAVCGACSRHLVDGCAEAVAALCSNVCGPAGEPRLPVPLRAWVLAACMALCASLPSPGREDALRFALLPPLRDLQQALQDASAALAAGSALDPHALSGATSIALLVAAFESPPLRSGALDFAAEAALPLLEQSVIVFEKSLAVVGCALVALQVVLRACPGPCAGVARLTVLLQLAVRAFQRQLSADAVILASLAVDALAAAPGAAFPRPSEVAATPPNSAFSAAASTLVAIAQTVLHASRVDGCGRAVDSHRASALSRAPDAVFEVLRLCRGLFDLCPAILVVPPVAEAAVLLAAMSLETAQPDVARCGAAVFRALATRQDLRSESAFASAADSAVMLNGSKGGEGGGRGALRWA